MAGSGEIHKRDDGTWGFRVRSSSGEPVAAEDHGLASRDDARSTVQMLLRGDFNGPISEAPTLMCGQEVTENTVLEGNIMCADGPAFIIAADNVTLDLNGFTVSRDPGSVGSGGPGILLRGVRGSTVQKGTIRGFGAGVAIMGGGGNVVQNLTVQDNVGAANGDFGDGITINGSSENRVQGNSVVRNGPFSGISVIGECRGNEIRDNTVSDNNMLHVGNPAAGRQDMGIRIEGPAANANRVVGNTVTGSGADGIVVLPTCSPTTPMGSECGGSPPNEFNEIIDNISNRNGTSGRGDGIRLFTVPSPVAAAHTTISGNTADENTTNGIGIDAIGSSNPGPTENRVSGNSAHGNGNYDGFDGNVRCGTNIWQGNDFGRVNQQCVMASGGVPAPPPPAPGGVPAPPAPPPPAPPPMPGERASVGPVELSVDLQGGEATVHVMYDINFSERDVQSNQVYSEVCRLMGVDVGVGDPAAAGSDDTLGFLTPLFNDHTSPQGGSPRLSRHFMKNFRRAVLNEDRGPIPNPDEIRAVVTLTPRNPATGPPIRQESNVVTLEL